VFLRGVDLRMGLIERVAGCFSDYRLPCLVEHKVAELLRQGIGALALGDEDLPLEGSQIVSEIHFTLFSAGGGSCFHPDSVCWSMF